MSHANRGKCVIFNHDIFDIGFEERKGSILDAKRIEVTFGKLGFEVEILDNLAHSDVMSKVQDCKYTTQFHFIFVCDALKIHLFYLFLEIFQQ